MYDCNLRVRGGGGCPMILWKRRRICLGWFWRTSLVYYTPLFTITEKDYFLSFHMSCTVLFCGRVLYCIGVYCAIYCTLCKVFFRDLWASVVRFHYATVVRQLKLYFEMCLFCNTHSRNGLGCCMCTETIATLPIGSSLIHQGHGNKGAD